MLVNPKVSEQNLLWLTFTRASATRIKIRVSGLLCQGFLGIKHQQYTNL